MTDQTTPDAPTKVCTACGLTKPPDAFQRRATALDGRTPRCRYCIAAELRERRAAERVCAAVHAAVERVAAERLAASAAATNAALDGAQDELADAAGLHAGPPLQPGERFRDRQVRLRLIRRRIEGNPHTPAAAAERGRRRMRAADAEVARLSAPPFDGHEALLLIADATDKDEGIRELGKALRGLGWTP